MQTQIAPLIATSAGWSAAIIRFTLALVVFPHGAQHLLGWFGGYGFTGTMGFFTQTAHLPYVIGALVILIEFFAPLLLLVGLYTRLAAAATLVVFIGIIVHSHWATGFFMDWYGMNPKPNPEGFEYHLLILGLCASLLISGGGNWSIDQRLSQKNRL